jgi:hypothetical protein
MNFFFPWINNTDSDEPSKEAEPNEPTGPEWGDDGRGRNERRGV